MQQIVALAGGIGGARFLRGLRHLVSAEPMLITVIGNTGDDLWIHGLRVCPDLDTVMYTLGDGISAERGWGREGETFAANAELIAYGAERTWFGLGDKDIATHLLRSQWLRDGVPLSEVTRRLCDRWQPGVRLLPMCDEPAETHVVTADGLIHFQEWWIRHRASVPAVGFELVGAHAATPAPGVLDALASADVIVLPPSNPIVSIGTILQVPGITDAIANASAPVVGISPIIGDAPVRGMADACLTALGLETSATAVAARYGAREHGGVLDGWLVDTSDESQVDSVRALGIACQAVPLFMTDLDATAAMARAAFALVGR